MGQARVTMALHPREAALIEFIRAEVPFGEVVVDIRDHLPQQVIERTVRDDLSKHIKIIVARLESAP